MGDGSAFSSPSLDGTFLIGRNEVRNSDYNSGAISENDRPSLRETFVVLNAGGSIMIREVAGSATTDWGFGSDLEVVAGGTQADGPSQDFQRGSLVSGGSAITVPTDGLYQIALDTEAAVMTVTPITWGLIGSATGGWSDDVVFNHSGINASGISYSLTGVELTADIFKVRSNNGWKVVMDTVTENGTANPGLVINTNLGNTVDELVAGGGDIQNTQSGIYNVTFDWTPPRTFEMNLDRTGDLVIDYSGQGVALIGDGVVNPGTSAANDWSTDIYASTPTQVGSAYVWTVNDVDLLSAGGFKVRSEGSWDIINVGYNDATLAGDALDNLIESGGNFATTTDATYDITFTIDGDTKTFTINNN